MISNSSQLAETTQTTHPLPMSAEQIHLIKTQVCKDATDDELRLFLHRCEKTRLDPFAGQIHAIKRWDSSQNRMAMKIQVGIDGLRLTAERTGKYEGQTPPQWCGDDGIFRDVWTSSEPPVAARIGVFRSGFREPLIAVAHYDELVQTKKNGTPTQFWERMPRNMIAKCCEAQALRKAFPADLSGLYISEELAEEEKIVIEPGETPMQAADPEDLPYAAKPGQKKLLLEILTELGIEDIEQMKSISEALKDNGVTCSREPMKEFIHGMLEVRG